MMSLQKSGENKVLEYRLRRQRSIGYIRFYKRDRLGKGSEHNTAVYKGKIISPEIREVAIKRVKSKHFTGDPQLLTSLSLEHENVISILFVESERNSPYNVYIAMELCQGTLKQLVEGVYKGPSPGSTGEMLRQITTGLQYLHSSGVIHRNLKPQNVLISNNEQLPPVLKLSDYSYLKNGQYCYKVNLPGWPVPELKNDEYSIKSLKRSADVYLLGCLFFYVVTQQEPFKRNLTRRSLMKNGVNKLTNATGVDNLITRMISLESAKRPSLNEILQHPYLTSAEHTSNIFHLSGTSRRVPSQQSGAPLEKNISVSQKIKFDNQDSTDVENLPKLLYQMNKPANRCSMNDIESSKYMKTLVNEIILHLASPLQPLQRRCYSLEMGDYNTLYSLTPSSSCEFSDSLAGSCVSLTSPKYPLLCSSVDNLETPRELPSNQTSPSEVNKTPIQNPEVAFKYLYEERSKVAIVAIDESITSRFQSIFHGLCIGLDRQELCYEARNRFMKLLKPKASSPTKKEPARRFLFFNETRERTFKTFAFRHGVNSAIEMFETDMCRSSKVCTLLEFRSLSTRSVQIDQPGIGDEALIRLKNVDSHMKAKRFLGNFGSHFCTGSQELGGLICYSVKLVLSAEETYEELKVMANQLLDDWLSSKGNLESSNKASRGSECSQQLPRYTVVRFFRTETQGYYGKLEEFEETVRERIDYWRLIERNISTSSICSVWNLIVEKMPEYKKQAFLLRDAWLQEAIFCQSSSIVLGEIKKTLRSSLVHLVSDTEIEDILWNGLVNAKEITEDDETMCKKISHILKNLEYEERKKLFLSLTPIKALCISKLIDMQTTENADEHVLSPNILDKKKFNFFCFSLTTLNEGSIITFRELLLSMLKERVTFLTDKEDCNNDLSSQYSDNILRLAIWDTMQKIVSERGIDKFKGWEYAKHHVYEQDLIQAQSLGLIVIENSELTLKRTVRTFTKFMHECFTNYLLAYYISFKLSHKSLLQGQEQTVYKMIITVILVDDEYEDVRKNLNDLLVIPSERNLCPFMKYSKPIEDYPLLGNHQFNDVLFETVKCRVDWNFKWKLSEESGSESSDDEIKRNILPHSVDDLNEVEYNWNRSGDSNSESSDNESIGKVTPLLRGSTAEILESYLEKNGVNNVYTWLIYCLKEKVLRMLESTKMCNMADTSFTFSTILLRSFRKATEKVENISENTNKMLNVLLHFFDSPNISWFSETFLNTVITFLQERSGPDASFNAVFGSIYQTIITENHTDYLKNYSKHIFPLVFGLSNSLAYRYITHEITVFEQACYREVAEEDKNCFRGFKSILKLVSMSQNNGYEMSRQAHWFLKNVTTRMYREEKFNRLMLTTLVAHLFTTLKDDDKLRKTVLVRALKLDVRMLNWLSDESNKKSDVMNELPDIHQAALENRELPAESSEISRIFHWSNINGHIYPPVIYLLACIGEVSLVCYNSEPSNYFVCENTFDAWFAGAMRYAIFHIKDEAFAVKLIGALKKLFGISDLWVHQAVNLNRRIGFFNYINDDSGEDKNGVSIGSLAEKRNWNTFQDSIDQLTNRIQGKRD